MLASTKIILCSPSPLASGGIAAWTKNILEYHKKHQNRQVNLMHLSVDRSYFIDPSSTSFTRRVLFGIKDYCRFLLRFRNEIKKERPNIVHITTSGSLGMIRDILMLLILKRTPARNVIHFHFGRIPQLEKKKNWEWYLLNILIKRANAVIVIDNASFTTLKKNGYTNINFLPNPVSPDLLAIVDRVAHVQREEWSVLFVGHVIKTKGTFELVRACMYIPNIKLKMIGKVELEMKKQLLEVAGKKGPLEWIQLLSNQSSEVVIKHMLGCSVLVLPSYTEGFPNVILEGMVCGCPIVATNVGAIPQMLHCNSNEEAGLCVTPQNVDELKNAIANVLKNKVLAEKLGQNARRRVLSEYRIEVIWQQLAAIWENALK